MRVFYPHARSYQSRSLPSLYKKESELLHHPAVQSKVRQFHSRMDSLQVSTCATCMERFPGMTVKMTSAGTECIRCTKDQHSPKTFSSDNNMNPGPVPQELMVSEIPVLSQPAESLLCMVSLLCDLITCVYLIVYRGLHRWRRCLSLLLCQSCQSTDFPRGSMGTVDMSSTCPKMWPPLPRVCQGYLLNWMLLLSGRREPTRLTVTSVSDEE